MGPSGSGELMLAYVNIVFSAPARERARTRAQVGPGVVMVVSGENARTAATARGIGLILWYHIS